MLEGKIPAGAAKAGLHLVEYELDLMRIAPLTKALYEFDWREAGAAALISFEHNSGDSRRIETEGAKRA